MVHCVFFVSQLVGVDETAANSVCQSVESIAFTELDYVSAFF